MAGLVVALDQLVVATALETIRRDLGASMADLEWTVNAFGLGFAGLLIPAAEFGDRIGRKRAYLSGLLLFAAALRCWLGGGPGYGFVSVPRARGAYLVALAQALYRGRRFDGRCGDGPRLRLVVNGSSEHE
ncbi:MFS transporter [Streptomyces galbus]|uniref:MFS transporter n=1 Tax=Streptomyces galbus TaxID=33898 RepID=UPI001E558A19|nr:MFS transporter [Streptomyces galbus]